MGVEVKEIFAERMRFMEKDKASVNIVKSIISIIVWLIFIGVVLRSIVFLSNCIKLDFWNYKLTDLISMGNIFVVVAIIFSACISYTLKVLIWQVWRKDLRLIE